MPLPIIHTYPVWLPRTQTWMHTQLCRLPVDRFEPHVVCDLTAHLDQFPTPRIHVYSAEHPLGYQFSRAARKIGWRYGAGFLAEVGSRIGAKLVHSHFGNIGWQNLPAVRRLGARHVVTFYGYDVGRLPTIEPKWKARYAELFAAVDLVLCEGPFMAQSIAALGCSPAKIRVHHLGIDIAEIKFRPFAWTPGTPLRVLMAASFVEKKGFPYAIAALARLKDEMPIEVTIIGDAPGQSQDNPEKQHILGAISAGGLGSHVNMLGYQPYQRLTEEAHCHHIFLSPSVTAADGDSEGGAPVALIEMAAAGLAIVSSRHCDIPSVVEHGRTGLLAGERDVEEIAAHLRWFAQHPSAWAPMLEAGRRHVEREYDACVQGIRLANLYDEALGLR